MPSKFLKHIPCPKCGSSDGNSLYDDGHTWCFICQKSGGTITRQEKGEDLSEDYNFEKSIGIRPLPKEYEDLKDRGISAATAKRFGVGQSEGEHLSLIHI